MSIKRINEFPEGSDSLSNDDVFLFMDNPSGSGITKKISLSQIVSAIGSSTSPILPYNNGYTYHTNDVVIYNNDIWLCYDGANLSGGYPPPTRPSSWKKIGNLDLKADATNQENPGVANAALDLFDAVNNWSALRVEDTTVYIQQDTVGGFRTALGLGSLATQSSIAYSSLSGTPSTFAPTAHKSQHAIGGSDMLTPANIGAASLPTSGLTITKNGNWGTSNPYPIFKIIPAQAFQIDDTYIYGSGKWISSFTLPATESSSNPITSLTFNDLEGATNDTSSIILDFGNSAPSLVTLSFPSLVFSGPIFMTVQTGITTLSLPNLRCINGNLTLGNLPALTNLTLTNLRYIYGNYAGGLYNVLTTFSLPNLILMTSSFSIATAPSLVNFTIPTNGTLKYINGNFTVSGAALSQSSVDNILQALASLDGTNNTISYGTEKSVDVSGGTSSAPSNSGSTTTTAAGKFSITGTTCNVAWTGHGYTNGDLLRISGITGLTNANKFAFITVTDANNFSYTVTTQAATAAGTATVRRYANGTNVFKLVTRGVTLTTN